MANNKRISINDKIKKPSLLDSTENLTSINETIKTNKGESTLKRQTYYIEPEMIKALGLKSVLEDRDKSEIVRAALSEYIEKRYFEID